MNRIYLMFGIFALMPAPAFAYIGPGAGLGAIAALVAIILGFVLLLVGFLWYPIRRILNRRRFGVQGAPKDQRESDGR